MLYTNTVLAEFPDGTITLVLVTPSDDEEPVIQEEEPEELQQDASASPSPMRYATYFSVTSLCALSSIMACCAVACSTLSGSCG